jgi:hypothetical protein
MNEESDTIRDRGASGIDPFLAELTRGWAGMLFE